MIKYNEIEYFTLVDLGYKLGRSDYNKLDLQNLDKLRLEVEMKIAAIDLEYKQSKEQKMNETVITKPEVEYTDLLYFGYDFNSKESKENEKHQNDFIHEIKDKFPNVELCDAYDQIKGFRQEVYLEKVNKDNYHSWLIGKGWFEFSMNMQLIMMSSEPKEREEFMKYYNSAKKEYPEAFKNLL